MKITLLESLQDARGIAVDMLGRCRGTPRAFILAQQVFILGLAIDAVEYTQLGVRRLMRACRSGNTK